MSNGYGKQRAGFDLATTPRVPKLSLLVVALLVATIGTDASAAPRSAAAQIGSDFVVVKSRHRAAGEFLGAKKVDDGDEEETSTPPRRSKTRRAVEQDEDRPTRRNLEGRSKKLRSAQDDDEAEDRTPAVRSKKSRRSAARSVQPTRRPMA